MTIETVTLKEFGDFVDRINDVRKTRLKSGEFFTDKSSVEFPFFPAYLNLIGERIPSVVEYGGAVPLLSLFLLEKERISRLSVVDNDASVLSQLEAVVKALGLKVEVLRKDINQMSVFPSASLGVSFNALYGYSPTPDQMNNPPKLLRPVVRDASHSGFGIFRYMNNCLPWEERDYALAHMREKYGAPECGSLVLDAPVFGFKNYGADIRKAGPQIVRSELHWIVGKES